MNQTRSAFTLMEVVMVMAILVIMGALAIPVVSSLFGRSHLNAAADTVRTQLVKAQNLAREQGEPYRFAIKENTGLFRIAPDAEDFWTGSAASEFAADGTGPTVYQGSLPENVYFHSAEGGDIGNDQIWTTVATFLTDGTAVGDVQIAVGMSGKQPIVIELRGATGSITIAALKVMANEY